MIEFQDLVRNYINSDQLPEAVLAIKQNPVFRNELMLIEKLEHNIQELDNQLLLGNITNRYYHIDKAGICTSIESLLEKYPVLNNSYQKTKVPSFFTSNTIEKAGNDDRFIFKENELVFQLGKEFITAKEKHLRSYSYAFAFTVLFTVISTFMFLFSNDTTIGMMSFMSFVFSILALIFRSNDKSSLEEIRYKRTTLHFSDGNIECSLHGLLGNIRDLDEQFIVLQKYGNMLFLVLRFKLKQKDKKNIVVAFKSKEDYLLIEPIFDSLKKHL